MPNVRSGTWVKRKAVHECVAGRLYERLLDDGILDRSLHPSGIPREADRWKPLLHGGETAGVSPACRECDAQLAASMGNYERRPDASSSQLGVWRIAGLLRSSRRKLLDFPDALQMDSRRLVSRAACGLTVSDWLQNSAFAK